MNAPDEDEFANRLRRAFDHVAGAAPVELAQPFTSAAVRRRRSRVPSLLAAALTLAVLYPLAFVVVQDDAEVPMVESSGRAAIKSPIAGWRWEMWGNVQLQVPDTWARNDDITSACSATDDTPPFVSRPDETGHNLMACDVPWEQAPFRVPTLGFFDTVLEPLQFGTKPTRTAKSPLSASDQSL